jgi:signal transduction histidine kinase
MRPRATVAAGVMRDDRVVDQLASLALFASVPRAELEWLIARGKVVDPPAGTRYRETGARVEEMAILLVGRMGFYATREGGSRKLLEANPGFVLGAIPYSRIKLAPGDTIVEEDATLLELHRDHFPDLVRACPELTAALVHHMVDRARDFRAVELHDERMKALGRLASGLAHELNNPASAAARSARSLAERMTEAATLSRLLMAARLSDDQLAVIDSVRALCHRMAGNLDPLELADREDDFTDWLLRHALDPGGADTLAKSALSLATLDELAIAVPADVLDAVIRWVTSDATAHEVARQIVSATGRIHDLVAAVKGFTFMDREAVPENVDIAKGLADTIAMLESRSRAKGIDVRIETAADLPRVFGFGSELNQVWEKLIDNAIDAVGRDGKISITATSRDGAVIVRVADDGSGIPDDIRSRVFDPFFTTKPVGQGTGLGLDVARRFVHLHHGDVHFTSQPGRTVFRVRLPVTGALAATAAPAPASQRT